MSAPHDPDEVKNADVASAANASTAETVSVGDGGTVVWHEGDMPYAPAFGDHFYSRHDGRAECAHVFLGGNGLIERFRTADALHIGELGFGTGLNFVETWRQWRTIRPEGSRLAFTSFERFPMTRAEIRRALSAWPELDALADALASRWPIETPPGDGSQGVIPEAIALAFEPNVTLTVHLGAAAERIGRIGQPVDAWYLDGFAPARNPEMWSADLMAGVHAATRPGGTFATYTAAGWVRRNLAAAGFVVTRRPGHAGKREMAAGYRPA